MSYNGYNEEAKVGLDPAVYEEIHHLLKDLGNSSDEIRRRLHQLGIRGIKGNEWECPVARYLTMNGFNKVYVQSGYISFINKEDGMPYQLPTSSALDQFILNFDCGVYWSLIEGE